jgi:5-methylcytosine-specific restriction enzyme subunit McrC
LTGHDRILSLTEHCSASLEDDWVRAVPASFWEQTKTTVTRAPCQGEWSVLAESYVGVARVKTDLGHLTLHISPKLDRCDSFFLADYAYGQRHQPLRQLPGEQALVDQVRNDPAACLLLWHILAIHRFSARWLRRDQVTLTKDLHGKIKGSIQLGRYITKHVALADAATIPCRLRERTQDTPNNRILKAGLRRAALLATDLPVPAARRAVRAAVSAALPRFAQVADVAGSPRDLRGTSTKGPLRHYTEVLSATIGFLHGDYLSGDLGSTGTTAFLWSMPTLFQEALRGIIAESTSLRLLDDVPVATIHDAQGVKRSSSKVDPDYVVRTAAGSTLLLDAKYKHAATSTTTDDLLEVPGARRIRVPRTDIYQMAAYRQHDQWANPAGALVYPISLYPGETLPAPYQVRGFGSPIHICFIDVGPNARTNLPGFLEHTKALVDGSFVATATIR